MVIDIPPYVQSPAGEHFVVGDESTEYTAYNIDGHWTIGRGHTGLLLNGTPVGPESKIGPQEMRQLYRMDVQHVLVALHSASVKYQLHLNQPQVDALTSLLFNSGVGLLEPSHSLGRAFQARDIEAVGKSILLYRMATINGTRGPYLQARREAEYAMFNSVPPTRLTADIHITPDDDSEDVCRVIPPTPGLDSLATASLATPDTTDSSSTS